MPLECDEERIARPFVQAEGRDARVGDGGRGPMSTSHRICETCVYCSFAGNCDRYDKPLTSIEQPACDAYEIHPLLAENAKLREQIHWLKKGDILHVLTDQEYIDQCERERLMQVSIDALDKENAKLRELAERAWKTAERLCQAFDGPCSDDGVTIYKPCPMGERDEECVYGQLQRELRELGVEVDE